MFFVVKFVSERITFVLIHVFMDLSQTNIVIIYFTEKSMSHAEPAFVPSEQITQE